MNISLGVLLSEHTRTLLSDIGFMEHHRASAADFTRTRLLPFNRVVLLVLQKSLKSIQLHLHEFFERLAGGDVFSSVSAGAWTHARAKLRHTAFIELNQVAVLGNVYADTQPVALWHGHRLLAIDSSTLRMPYSKALFDFFGGQEPSNQNGSCETRVPQARLSVLFDCLNWIGVDTQIGKFRQGEVALASDHLSALRPGDVVVSDRGYAGYLFFARVRAHGGHFIIRCQERSFAAAKELFKRNEDGASITVTLSAKTRFAEAEAAGLPTELKVRFLSVRLSTGELEVIATSLLDEETYPTQEFLKVYYERWGIETYYKVIKGRLDLENFSGLTVEAILQDVHASVFLSNFESVVTREAAALLPKAGSEGRSCQTKLNKAVTFHALKCRIMDLLLGKKPIPKVLAELTELFLANPVTIRSNRNPPRTHPTPLTSLNYQKRVRKVVF